MEPFGECAAAPAAKRLAKGECGAEARARRRSELLKAGVELPATLLLLAASSPLLLLIALLVRLDSAGPAFFLQRRCGKGGKEFRMYKFRTMVEDAEARKALLQNEVDGPMFKVAEDPRVTRIGRYLRKTSLDELPQLINVLRGEMSLVGPRPLAAEEMEGNGVWRELRLSVKPGITGLWQVKGRATRQFSDWVQYDTEYVANRSLLLDAKILLQTVPAVLRRRGAV